MVQGSIKNLTKRLVIVSAVMLVFTGNVFSQGGLSAYEKKLMDAQLKWIKGITSLSTKYATTQSELANAAQYAQQYITLAAAPDSKQKADRVNSFKSQLGLILLQPMLATTLYSAFGMAPPTEMAKLEEFGKINEQFEKEANAAESLMNPAELKKLREEKYGGRYFYFSNKDNFSGVTKKGEFETTSDYNKRINDSTAHYLKECAFRKTKEIVESVLNKQRFEFGGYNADKGIYTVKAGFVGRGNIVMLGDPNMIEGIMPISPQEAKELVNNYYISIDPADVFLSEYYLYPSKISVINKTDTTKKYTATFPKPSGATDIVFRGSELWASNPKAANLVYYYKEIVAEQRRIAEQQQAELQRLAAIAAEQKRLQDSIAAVQKAEQQRIQAEYQTELKRIQSEKRPLLAKSDSLYYERQTSNRKKSVDAELQRVNAELQRVEAEEKRIKEKYGNIPLPKRSMQEYQVEMQRITTEYQRTGDVQKYQEEIRRIQGY